MVRLLGASDTMQAEAGQGTIYIVTSDYGAECDDQKAWSQFVTHLQERDAVFVMAGGPQPSEAARAMAQAVKNKTDRYPVTAEATQFEGHKTPKEKIFSLADGKPIYDQKLPGFAPVEREEWQGRIDDAVKSNKFSKLEIVIISPIFAGNEVYDVSRAKSDPELAASLDRLTKTANIQMIRKDGEFQAYNYTKSAAGLPEKFQEMAAQAGFTMTFVDGNSAKDNAFKISARQPVLPGVENSIGFYMENLQVPWASMPGPTGTVPRPEQMHVTMLTSKGEYPCLFHMSGAYTHGFGRERLAKDICAISDKSEYESFSKKAEEELDRFDKEVLKSLLGEKCNVPAMRRKMHTAMLSALNTFAEEKGVQGQFGSFKDFFDRVDKMAKETNSEPVVSPFKYIDDYKAVLFRDNAWYKEITDHAQDCAGRVNPDGKSHVGEMAAIIKNYNAQAVSFDAVTLAAAHAIENDSQLAAHFTEQDGVRVVNPAKIADLREVNRGLHDKFVSAIRAEMTRDGTAMAYGAEELGLVKPRKVALTGNLSEELIGIDAAVRRPASPVGLAQAETQARKRTYSETGLGGSGGADQAHSADAPPSAMRRFNRPDRSGRDTL